MQDSNLKFKASVGIQVRIYHHYFLTFNLSHNTFCETRELFKYKYTEYLFDIR